MTHLFAEYAKSEPPSLSITSKREIPLFSITVEGTYTATRSAYTCRPVMTHSGILDRSLLESLQDFLPTVAPFGFKFLLSLEQKRKRDRNKPISFSLVRSKGLEPIPSRTRPSTVRVCLFRHDRICSFISNKITLCKTEQD